eukprot:1086360-Pyramimonas_sp.AAC.1
MVFAWLPYDNRAFLRGTDIVSYGARMAYLCYGFFLLCMATAWLRIGSVLLRMVMGLFPDATRMVIAWFPPGNSMA